MARINDPKAKEARNRYMREYRRKNREKLRRYEENYWKQKYEEYKQQDQKKENG